MQLDERSVDLVISDPPYWKVVSEKWDYAWRTEQDYYEWSLKWMSQVARVLRYGGSFYMFGYFRTLAHLVPKLADLGLELRQQIVIDKGIRSVSGRATRNYKMFPNTTESCLLIIKDNKQFLKPFLKDLQKKQGLSAKEINEALGLKSNGGGMWSIYTGKNVCAQFPTEELWTKLQSILGFEMEYMKVAQVFNAQMGLTDVWTDIDFYRENRIHPTQKPLDLIERLVRASSNENDLVLDPFMGSGTTGVACLKHKRNFIGIEADEGYYSAAKKRILAQEAQGTLF